MIRNAPTGASSPADGACSIYAGAMQVMNQLADSSPSMCAIACQVYDPEIFVNMDILTFDSANETPYPEIFWTGCTYLHMGIYKRILQESESLIIA